MSKIIDDALDSVKNLYEAGIVDIKTMRKFEDLALEPTKSLSKTAIKNIRLREKVSQPIFAHYLNVSPSTVKKWESGEKNPSGAALKLLHVVNDHGLNILQSSNYPNH